MYEDEREELTDSLRNSLARLDGREDPVAVFQRGSMIIAWEEFTGERWEG